MRRKLAMNALARLKFKMFALQFLPVRLRADLARGRIETTAGPVERIAEAVGFGDAENMRRAFIRIYGYPSHE